ncbi:MAG: glycosyltransferase family 2 protein [Terracoccus sp.]
MSNRSDAPTSAPAADAQPGAAEGHLDPPLLLPRSPSGAAAGEFVAVQRTVPYERRHGVDRRRSMEIEQRYRVAVLLPCRNEATTIGGVVEAFAEVLPTATIWVYDNNSSDDTLAVAKAARASVQEESKPGKGQVVRRMFSEIDADIYVISDGDATYDAEAAPLLIEQLVTNRLDMVVGRRRVLTSDDDPYPAGHRLGNAVLTGVVQYIFGQGSLDMLSGYRVLSRRYVKSFPITSRGFEIETEMTVHALDLGLPFSEVDTVYRERPPDSHSKLRTIPDGMKITWFILRLVSEFHPAALFGSLALVFGVSALVARFALYAPLISLLSAGGALALVVGLVVSTVMLLGIGPVLEAISRGRRDVKRMMYLSAGGPGPGPGPIVVTPPAAGRYEDHDPAGIHLRSKARR